MTSDADRLDLIPFRLLIDRTTQVARKNLGRFFWPTAVPLLAVGVLLAVLQIQWMKSAFDPQSGDISGFFESFGLILLVSLLGLVLYVLLYMALAVAAVDAVAGRPVSMGRAWAFSLRPTVLGTSLVTAVIVGVSFVLCCVPGLFVAPLFALLIPVMVEEHRVGLGALSRTVELVRFRGRSGWADNAWAQSFVVLFIGTVLSYAASLVTQGPFVIVQQVMLIRQTAAGQAADPAAIAGSLWLQVPAQVLGALVTVLVWAYWSFGLALLYFEVRRRKEAYDLEAAIGDITATPGSGPGVSTSSAAS